MMMMMMMMTMMMMMMITEVWACVSAGWSGADVGDRRGVCSEGWPDRSAAWWSDEPAELCSSHRGWPMSNVSTECCWKHGQHWEGILAPDFTTSGMTPVSQFLLHVWTLCICFIIIIRHFSIFFYVMKLFKTTDINIVEICHLSFLFYLLSDILCFMQTLEKFLVLTNL